MSVFYKSMSRLKSEKFKEYKRRFKRGKPCAHCGKRLPSSQMSIDHIIPIEQFNGSPYDKSNWQVLCLPCHRIKTMNENIESAKRRADESNKTPMPYSAVFGAILKKDSNDAED